MRVLVLDGNQNQAVACVRSLAAKGHTVLVGNTSAWSKAGWSRSCAGTFVYPSPRDGNRMIASLAELARQEPGTLILPMSDATTLMISANRDVLLQAGAKLVMPAHEDVVHAADKSYTTELARSRGIAVPRSIVISSAAEARGQAASLPYPVVLKPRSSEEQEGSGASQSTGRPLYARTADEFQRAYDELSKRTTSVLVQEFIPGGGTGYFALMRNCELRAEFAHRRIRDVHPTGSGSAVRASIKPEPKLRDASLAILKALNWHGVAMVEFRQRPNGEFVFLEVNGRFWNSLPLACYAGADFPAALAEIAESGDCTAITDYKVGVRCRWLSGDFRHLLAVWHGAPKGYPAEFPGRVSTLIRVLTPVPGTYHDNFQLTDPLPELGDWLSIAQRIFEKKKPKEQLSAEGRYSHS
jgi:predicted ATP-grasp superfamily ATP-dependent carboligase